MTKINDKKYENELINHDNDRKNNFNVLRFLAAFAVILGHAPILTGSDFKFPISLGTLAVDIFFLISGYLICGSWKSRGNNGFISARIFRIMPALIVVNFLVAFVVGPIISEISLYEYFTNVSPYFYFLGTSAFILTGRGVIKGVFGDKSPNGSLWTLLFEVVCYVLVWILGMLNLLKTKVLIFLLLVLIIVTVFEIKIPYPYPFTLDIGFTRLFICFIAGMIVQLYKGKVISFIRSGRVSLCIFIFSFFLFVILNIFKVNHLYVLPSIGYMVFYLAFCNTLLSKFGSKYDLSYGIYIYAYPIQMLVVKYINITNRSLPLNIILVAGITLILSFLSCKFIEKPMIAFRKRIF